MFNKVWKAMQAAGSLLDGKKRRIAYIAGIVASVAAPHTVVGKVAQVVLFLAGGADALQHGAPAIKNKLLKNVK